MPPSTNLHCAACGLTFHDSTSHGMHLLTRRHRERVGQLDQEHKKPQPTLNDLKMLVERMRSEKERAIFGQGAAVAAAGDRRQRGAENDAQQQTGSYFGRIARDPAPHQEVVDELARRRRAAEGGH